MFRPRVIPVLLLKNNGLVKSEGFKQYTYIGDPINAVRIFNDLRADELVFLDIEATAQNRCISPELVKDIGDEANMPFAVGGGIRTIQEIRELINAGAEKVIINAAAATDPEFVRKAAATFGSSTIVVCMDVKKKFLGGLQTWTINGTKASGKTPVEFAKQMQAMGAGELIVQSIERDGKMQGYDLELIRNVSEAVTIPVVALGGAGKLNDLKDAFVQGKATGLAAGSLFVYQGSMKGVLINYPERGELSFE
jgi:cyclase